MSGYSKRKQNGIMEERILSMVGWEKRLGDGRV
jgi:hypothetical protein